MIFSCPILLFIWCMSHAFPTKRLFPFWLRSFNNEWLRLHLPLRFLLLSHVRIIRKLTFKPSINEILECTEDYNGNSGSLLSIPEQLTMNHGSGLGLAKWFLVLFVGLVIILKWKRELKRNVLSITPSKNIGYYPRKIRTV